MCGTQAERLAGVNDRVGTSEISGDTTGKVNNRSTEPSGFSDNWNALESKRLNGHLESNLRHTVYLPREEGEALTATAAASPGGNRGSNSRPGSPPLTDDRVEVVIRNGRQIFDQNSRSNINAPAGNVQEQAQADPRMTGIYSDSRPTGINVDPRQSGIYNDQKPTSFNNGNVVSNHAANTNIGYAPIPQIPQLQVPQTPQRQAPSFKRNISNLVQGQVKKAISQVESVMGARYPQPGFNGNPAYEAGENKPFFTRMLDHPVDIKPVVKRTGIWGLLVPLLLAFIILFFAFAYVTTF